MIAIFLVLQAINKKNMWPFYCSYDDDFTVVIS